MIFNSIQFVIFFIVVTSLYFSLPHNKRWLLLLLSSCYFYMAFVPIYILILGFTIVVDYFAGILIEDARGKRRKLFLLLSTLPILAYWRYSNTGILLQKIFLSSSKVLDWPALFLTYLFCYPSVFLSILSRP